MAVRIGVLLLSTVPISIRVYVAWLRPRLERAGLSRVEFADPQEPPTVGLNRDPRADGGRAPTAALLNSGRPVVAALHHMAHLSPPRQESDDGLLAGLKGRWHCLAVAPPCWQAISRLSRIIVPSGCARDEAVHILDLNPACSA